MPRRSACLLAGRAGLSFAADAHAALAGADALAIVTEWQEFRSPDFDQIKVALKQPVIFDGRNLYNPELMSAAGLQLLRGGARIGLAGAVHHASVRLARAAPGRQHHAERVMGRADALHHRSIHDPRS